MQYNLLSMTFYNKHKHHKEILQKKDRPYCVIVIKIGNLNIGIPFRSHIKHKYAYFTQKRTNQAPIGGLDYTKAVVLDLSTDIDNNRKAYIRKDDFRALLGREYKVESGFGKFLTRYKNAVKAPNLPENKFIVQISALQYFHKELGI